MKTKRPCGHRLSRHDHHHRLLGSCPVCRRKVYACKATFDGRAVHPRCAIGSQFPLGLLGAAPGVEEHEEVFFPAPPVKVARPWRWPARSHAEVRALQVAA